MVCIEIPRCDTNEGVEGGAIELTVTSELQAHLSWPRAGLANHLSAWVAFFFDDNMMTREHNFPF